MWLFYFSISNSRYCYTIKQNYKYRFYQIISIYVSHFSVNLEEDSGSGFISRPSNCQLFAYADFLGSSLNYFSSFIANVFSLVFAHGTISSKRDFLIKSGKYDLVIYGHTHRKTTDTIGRTVVVNPGTAKGWIFGFNATIAICDTSTRNIEFVNLWLSYLNNNRSYTCMSISLLST